MEYFKVLLRKKTKASNDIRMLCFQCDNSYQVMCVQIPRSIRFRFNPCLYLEAAIFELYSGITALYLPWEIFPRADHNKLSFWSAKCRVHAWRARHGMEMICLFIHNLIPVPAWQCTVRLECWLLSLCLITTSPEHFIKARWNTKCQL